MIVYVVNRSVQTKIRRVRIISMAASVTCGESAIKPFDPFQILRMLGRILILSGFRIWVHPCGICVFEKNLPAVSFRSLEKNKERQRHPAFSRYINNHRLFYLFTTSVFGLGISMHRVYDVNNQCIPTLLEGG